MYYNTKDQYQSQIDACSAKYNSILLGYKNLYIASVNYPSGDATKNLNLANNQLQTQINGLIRIQTEIGDRTKTIVSDSTDYNNKIGAEKTKNNNFKKQLTALDPIKSGASALIGDYQTNYNDKNTRNWSLLIGIVVACAMITFMFRIPTTKDDMIRARNETINKLRTAGQEVDTKYRILKEKGKVKAAEAERMLDNATKRAEIYKKQAFDVGQETKAAPPVAAQKTNV